MPFFPPFGGAGRVALLIVMGWAGTRSAAADDDFLVPPPFVQAAAEFEQGEVAKAEALALPLASGAEASPEACSLLGRIRLKQGRVPEAVEQFERAVAKNPASAVLRSQLGEALLAQAEQSDSAGRAGLLARARVELERAAAADAGCLDAQMGLLRLHLMAPEAGPAGAAERYAARAAELDPLSANYDIGELAEKHGRDDLAERHFGAAARLLPTIPWLPFKHGVALLKLGRVAEARAELTALLKAFPEFSPAQEILAKLPAQ